MSLALAAALALCGTELVYGQRQPEGVSSAAEGDANAKPAAGTPTSGASATGKGSPVQGGRVAHAIRLHHAAAADVAATINGFLEKKLAGKRPTDNGTADTPAVVAEPVTNHLLVSALPQDLEEIKGLIAVLDVVPRQFLIEAVVYEGDPPPAAREAPDQGKASIVCRPQLVTIENQTALVNSGEEVEFPAGSRQVRHVGILLQISVGHGDDKQVPVRAVTEVSSVSKDRSAINVQRIEHSANFVPGERTRIRGGKTISGKEFFVDMTVTEITSRAQLEKARKSSRD